MGSPSVLGGDVPRLPRAPLLGSRAGASHPRPPNSSRSPSASLHGSPRNGFEQQLRAWDVVQKNSKPSHPTTCGKVERFQQTMKNWLRKQPDQPSTIDQLQTLLDRFRTEYNHHRPHRSLPHRATPATLYNEMPKALPAPTRDAETHDRVRHDRVDKSGTVTLRVHGQLRHIGIGRTHKGTHVILLAQDLEVRVVNAVTGELLRELTIDTSKDYQPRTPK
jgi:hypothetical protein